MRVHSCLSYTAFTQAAHCHLQAHARSSTRVHCGTHEEFIAAYGKAVSTCRLRCRSHAIYMARFLSRVMIMDDLPSAELRTGTWGDRKHVGPLYEPRFFWTIDDENPPMRVDKFLGGAVAFLARPQEGRSCKSLTPHVARASV